LSQLLVSNKRVGRTKPVWEASLSRKKQAFAVSLSGDAGVEEECCVNLLCGIASRRSINS